MPCIQSRFPNAPRPVSAAAGASDLLILFILAILAILLQTIAHRPAKNAKDL